MTNQSGRSRTTSEGSYAVALRFRGYIGKDQDLDDAEVQQIFRKRHAAGFWLGIVPIITFFLMALWPVLFGNDDIISFVLGGVVFLIAFFYIHLVYRCPRCDSVPRSSKFGVGGVIPFPKRCWKCHAPLLPGHRWGQD